MKDPGKWFELSPDNQSWREHRHAWFWYCSQHWAYTGLSPQALVTWLALFRFCNSIRSTAFGSPGAFSVGLPDKTGSRSKAHRRAIKELLDVGLITRRGKHSYDLSPASDFALALHTKVTKLQADAVMNDILDEEPMEEGDEPYLPEEDAA